METGKSESEKREQVKYRRYAISQIQDIRELYPLYLDMLQDETLVESFRLLGIDINDLQSYSIFEFYARDIEEVTTIELLDELTQIKHESSNIIKRLDDAQDVYINSSGLTFRKSEVTVLGKLDIQFKDIYTAFRSVIQCINRCYSFLIMQAFIDIRGIKGNKLQDYLESVGNVVYTGLDEIKYKQDSALLALEEKTQLIERRFDEIKKEFAQQDDKMIETAHGLIEQIDKNFSSQQSTNLEAVTKKTRSSINEIQLEAQNASNQFHKHVDSKISEINSRIKKEINEFETHKIAIEGILGDISHAHQSNANRIQADKEQKVADRLRVFGVVGLILVIVFSLYLFNSYLGFFGETKVTDAQLTSQWFLVRFLTITLLTGPFIYLLKESACHRSKENLYRQRGTQLSSIGAYLSELDIDERTLLKKELARNFFSFHDGKADTQNVPDFLKDMKQLVGIARSINGQSRGVGDRLRRK
ncbi:hypothetical protein ACCF70_001470 [Vibrio parahaemolyticus]|nr:hypothetical protein [Vibrio parahaemolyticus]EJY0896426.1 hypothetical protein [Vibrio parahaemolyticus]EKO5229920.1 hypothetical protein [Vibrio parahaemolyticus]ELA7344090.1 hypothetical protein [Vibrio parahaemolyticus]HCE2184484.1 hypothetical protein [Vibrio parahaemolyticus]